MQTPAADMMIDARDVYNNDPTPGIPMSMTTSAMTLSERRRSFMVALVVALCLVAASPPQIVGDGDEYLALALNFASLHGPSISTRDMAGLHQQVVDYSPMLGRYALFENAVTGRDGRRDFMHFWFFSLLATPLLWIAQAIGLPAVYGFVGLNLILFLLALWTTLPRLGGAACLLLFGSPVVWSLDKASPEVFMFSLLMIAFVLMREKPWWAVVAAGAASTQNPPILAVLGLILVVSVIPHLGVLRDRRFVAGAVVALVLGVLHPAYYYWRYGTPSELLRVVNTGVPSYAELSAVILDPNIGLVGNIPVFALVMIAALALIIRREPKALLSRDILVAWIVGAVFLVTFGKKDNVHNGATPSMSRYVLWLMPLAVPFLTQAWRLGGTVWRHAMWAAGAASAAVCVLAFHPSVPENGREPIWLAQFLWTKHPTWNNPLPEVFVETMVRTEEPVAPVSTAGCEKVLLGGTGERGIWPIPCFPAPVDPRCLSSGVWCYANRRGAEYEFSRAPGIWNRRAEVQPKWVWSHEAESHVRTLYTQWDWPTLQMNPGNFPSLRSVRNVHATVLLGPDRFILVLREPGQEAMLFFRLDRPMVGVLVDPDSGVIVRTLHFDGPPGEPWYVPLPQGAKVLLLALRPG